MGEKIEPENAFIIRDDGSFVSFDGITEVQLSNDTDLNDIDTDAVYAHFNRSRCFILPPPKRTDPIIGV